MGLKQNILQQVKSDEPLKIKIAEANKKKLSTVFRWLRNNDTWLPTEASVDTIKAHFGIDAAEKITE